MYLTEYGHLVVDEFGAKLKKIRKRIEVSTVEEKQEFPVKSVKDVIISGKVNISSELLKYLSESGVGVLFTTPTGRPVARVVSAKLGGSSENRYEQYDSLRDERGVEIARNLIAGKIRNQMSNLRYYSKSRRMNEDVSKELYRISQSLREILDRIQSREYSSLEDARKEFITIEGEAANQYWDGMKIVLSRWNFSGRSQNNNDPVNFSLNVAYNLLSGQIWKYVLIFSLDPFSGYVHVERPGRLSLVYDLIEPFRPIADRFVVSFLRHHTPAHFSQKRSAVVSNLIKSFYSDFLESKLEYRGKKMKIENIMFYFTQSVVSHLRRKGKISVPYLYW